MHTFIGTSGAIALVVSLVITCGLYQQVYKIWRTKSAKDFVATLVIALVLEEAAWLNYGIDQHLWPVIILTTVNLPAMIGLAVGYILYRKGAESGDPDQEGKVS